MTLNTNINSQSKRGKRQAVVIVHGMGEQRPLETLRGFAETVLGEPLVSTQPPFERNAWLVPDTRAGSQELARITTRRKDGVRTDFYELYWSDLLVNNSMGTLRAWIWNLLFRWPHQVPRETVWHWLVLWILVIVFAAIAIKVGSSASLEGLRDLFLSNGATTLWSAPLSISLTLALIIGLNLSMLKKYNSDAADGDSVFRGTWQNSSAYKKSVGLGWGFVFVTVFSCFIGYMSYKYLAWDKFPSFNAALIILGIGLGILIKFVGLPIFGDVARYVSTSPDSVSARASIRERGLNLMRALHGPIPGARAAENSFGDSQPYDRVVLVGHSLGSIIAYDVLRLFWMERGATRNNPPDKKSIAALEAMNQFCISCGDVGTNFDLSTFQTLQNDVFAALSSPDGGWLISDFITLGSPLTHAEFLISEDRLQFEKRKAERLFPTIPPMLEIGEKNASFLYLGSDRKRLAHHAAPFCAVHWTNIFDKDKIGLTGDFISGPCQPNFGPGVKDVHVEITRPGWKQRFFTHTSYWDLASNGKILSHGHNKDGEKQHIQALKDALNL